ncbi:M20/M25/M40 family metallo-hydrolase [Methanobacterium sp.]|uniref:M20/M25/M40 family metallo-hydrolase n=1 Tax=Methanobacterium sp. TaxID=2164 RepID=UPI003C774587
MQKALEYVDENLDTFIEDLKSLCSIPSISSPNEGIKECVTKIREILEESGLNVKVLELEGANPVVYGDYKPEHYDKTIIFYNHYDVQPADPLELWESPPFEPAIRDGKLFARGVADNKGNIIARIKAIESILRTDGDLPVAVKFVFEGEEEVGGISLPKYIDKYKDLFEADIGVWESGDRHENERPSVKLGYKGIAFFEFFVRKADKDVHSGRAGLVPNPVWRLIEFLSSLRDEKGKILIDGFYDDIDINNEDEELLKGIPFDDEEIKEEYGLEEFVGKFEGFEALKSLYLKPTCNIDGIKSGYIREGTKTIVPSEASVKVDFRIFPGQTPEKLLENLHEHIEKYGFTDVEVKYYYGYESAKTSPSSFAVRIIEEATRKTYNREPLIYPMSVGSSPIYNFINKLGIPTVSIGAEYWGSLVHSPNENIRIEDFRLAIKNVVNIIDELSKH